MWLRLALNLSVLLLFSACSPSDKAAVDKLNSLSYAYHYRNIDSTEVYARQALAQASAYTDGRAEALNNLAFVSMTRMDYEAAQRQLTEAISLTDNQIELLIAEIQHMRLCQRRSENRAFYEHRERAQLHLKRIGEERSELSPRLQRRLIYAESELAIVNSTYYYYVGLERQSVKALKDMNIDEVRHDTAQYLNYLYNVGAGGVITEGTPEEIYREETDFLYRCLNIATRFHFPYFEANAKEALAEHDNNLILAEEALELFSQFGDVYQIAGAHRTLASCYHALNHDEEALHHLNLALSDHRINQAPDLVASIREQLSVAYAAVNDKAQSDYNRNSYLDLQEQTRQDRELEARAGILDASSRQLNLMILAVLIAIVLLLFMLWLFNHLNQKSREDHQLDNVLEQKADELSLRQLSVEKSSQRHLEQRAKVSLVNSITPLIDRIIHEVDKISAYREQQGGKPVSAADDAVIAGRIEYIRELTEKINEQNDLLTHWIKLRQGELSLHIESFALQPLFDVLARAKTGFDMKGVSLDVQPTTATVKADRVLTLFMLNTLSDNARKFTDRGGRVTIMAQEVSGAIELSVQDTGCGMTDDQLAHVFDHKSITEESAVKGRRQQSHGFGLMNCKGIIEKYRKLSPVFSCCQISAQSEQGRGSRFSFRLPKGVKRIVLLLFMLPAASLSAQTQQQTTPDTQLVNPQLDYMSKAHVFADSAYFSNVNGTYERTLLFADSCRKYLNLQYLSQRPKGTLLMMADGDTSVTPPEIQWFHDNLDVNYQIILDIRNESAVAALALHLWQLYAYNNKVYTQLFKEMSADSTLATYCRTMQQSQSNKRIAIILLIVLLLLIIPAYYMLYYRHRLYSRHRREQMQLDNIEMADDELRRAELEDNKLHVVNAVLDNCLSTLKHETMYYPSRIRQMVDQGDMDSLGEVTHYYRELYGILSQQAMRQVEQIKFHITKTSCHGQLILADQHMVSYLFQLLSPTDVQGERKDDNYVVFHCTLSKPLSHLDSLLCRQIVRDHGEATHRRGCGITVSDRQVTITLPAAKTAEQEVATHP